MGALQELTDSQRLSELAKRFETRAHFLLDLHDTPVGERGDLYVRSEIIAQIANCFTIAAALRARGTA